MARPSTPTAARGVTVRFRPFLAGDAVQLALQPSQHVTLGIAAPRISFEHGQELEAHSPTAWTAIGDDGRILVCAGLQTLWPANERTGGHVLAWALLTTNLGAAHVAITRFLRKVVLEDPASRVEALTRACCPAECRWAELVGMRRSALLRAWGPEGEDHVLYERVRGVQSHSHPLGDASKTELQLEALGAV